MRKPSGTRKNASSAKPAGLTEPTEIDTWWGLPGDSSWLGLRDVAAMCEDCSSAKAGPTWIAHRMLDADMPDLKPLVASLVNNYVDELTIRPRSAA